MQNDVYGGAFLNLLYPSTIAQDERLYGLQTHHHWPCGRL